MKKPEEIDVRFLVALVAMHGMIIARTNTLQVLVVSDAFELADRMIEAAENGKKADIIPDPALPSKHKGHDDAGCDIPF